jgi:hypothetical protein
MADEGSARLAAFGTREQPLGSSSTSRRGQHRHGEEDEGRRRAHQQEGKEQGGRRWGVVRPWEELGSVMGDGGRH